MAVHLRLPTSSCNTTPKVTVARLYQRSEQEGSDEVIIAVLQEQDVQGTNVVFYYETQSRTWRNLFAMDNVTDSIYLAGADVVVILAEKQVSKYQYASRFTH